MKLITIILCVFLLLMVSGCSQATTNIEKTEQKIADTQTSSLANTEEKKTEEKKADEEIIMKKFTFMGVPETDKKIMDGKVKDGIYEADTPPSEYGHKGYVKLTVKNGQVTEVVFYQWDPKKDSYKDENYGKEYGTQFGPDTFKNAQISVEGAKKYPVELIKKQDLSEVDVVSGATYNLSVFRKAVNKALAKGLD